MVIFLRLIFLSFQYINTSLITPCSQTEAFKKVTDLHLRKTGYVGGASDIMEELHRDSQSVINTEQGIQDMKTTLEITCGKQNKDLVRFLDTPKIEPQVTFKDRLLVVEFNNPHYESIPFLESLYRPAFPNILYCTLTPIENATVDFELFTMKLQVHEVGYLEDWMLRRLFVEVIFKTNPRRTVSYNLMYIIHDQSKKIPDFMSETPNFCIEAAIQKMPSFKGYIYMADDTVFHYWRTASFDPDKFWWYDTHPTKILDVVRDESIYCKSNVNGKLSGCSPVYWFWFENYRMEIKLSLQTMVRYSSLSRKCLKELVKRSGGRMAVVGGQTDFYYVPRTRALDFLHMSNLFRTTRLWHEMSITMMMYCLNKPEEIVVSNLYHNWNYDTDRREPWKWYPSQLTATSVHPLKLGQVAHRKKKDTRLFCNLLFPNLVNHVYNGNLTIG